MTSSLKNYPKCVLPIVGEFNKCKQAWEAYKESETSEVKVPDFELATAAVEQTLEFVAWLQQFHTDCEKGKAVDNPVEEFAWLYILKAIRGWLKIKISNLNVLLSTLIASTNLQTKRITAVVPRSEFDDGANQSSLKNLFAPAGDEIRSIMELVIFSHLKQSGLKSDSDLCKTGAQLMNELAEIPAWFSHCFPLFMGMVFDDLEKKIMSNSQI